MRFALETVRAVREAVGSDFHLFYRMNARELDPGGVTLEDAAAFAPELARAGVDIIDASASGGLRRTGPSGPVESDPTARFPEYAAAVRPNAGVPVIAVGRVHRPETAEAILAEGKADLVAVGRQMLADPFWVEKAASGRASEIVACDSCNACHVDLARGVPIRCKVNRRAGREYHG
jgi:2,4-dienoyl-CoA reductase (NADPH2)